VDADERRGDEFERRLKDLGYLENPLDKFFIGGAHGRTGVLVANLKIAVKVGVLGGVLLGIVTAAGLSLITPESFSGFAGPARLAGYLSIIFTALFTALQLVVCLAVTVMGRFFRWLFTRTQMIALYSGLFAGLVVLLYGTLWWWGQGGEATLVSARSAAAFGVIAAAAGGIALLTRLAVTALLALLGGADLGARGKGRATKVYFAVLVAGLVIFVGYRLATVEETPERPAEFEKVNTGLSVTLIAVDGASLDFFEYLKGEGDIPNLAALADAGVTAPLAEPPLHVNPAVWTTVATGMEPDRHGVTAYSSQEIPGIGLYVRERVGFGLYDAMLKALPAVGLSRRAPLERRSTAYPHLWDIVATKGELSGVVNWWGTWPADLFHGFLVTDRMYPKLQVALMSGEAAAFRSEVYPRALFDRLKGYSLEKAKISDDPYPASSDIDRFAVTALLEARGDYTSIALSAVYLPGLDVYTNTLEDPGAPQGLADKARLVEGARSYWRFLDGLLEPIIASRSEEDVIILVGDPGMLKGPERHAGRTERGFVVFSGGPVVSSGGRVDGELALVDIAPAVLYLLGFPVSREMDGRAPVELVSDEFRLANPPREVETYGRLSLEPPGEYDVSGALVERLRSLGYLQQ
jgi:hypothetical protein